MCTSARARGDCNKRGGRCQGTRCVGGRSRTYTSGRRSSRSRTRRS